MRRDLRRFLDRLTRLAALLVWVGQLGLVVAPFADAHAGEGSAAHVEARGEARHAAHNPDLCYACASQALTGSPPAARAPLAAPARVLAAPIAASTELRSAAWTLASRPRAPPRRVLAA